MSNEIAYFSRFFLKFVEIIAAGLATAVSGYLIAHFTWLSSSPAVAPAPASMQISSSAGDGASKGLPTQTALPISADTNELLTPQPDAKVLALQPAFSNGRERVVAAAGSAAALGEPSAGGGFAAMATRPCVTSA